MEGSIATGLREQLRLPLGPEEGQRPTPRTPERARTGDPIFFALLPDEAAKARIADLGPKLRRGYRLAGQLISPGRLHISLQGVDARTLSPRQIIAAARRAAAAVGGRPFEVRLDRVLSLGRGESRPLVLAGGEGDLGALTAFHRALGVEMMKAGLARAVRPDFRPHLTLLYDSHAVPEMEIAPISWTACEFVLIRSLYGQSCHIHHGRWPLR